ncbi:MAB_1171c family putative transporter [Streptomyces sp. NPDC014872]|uniref:MAB_1171c family putative transporter n=1 Tax=Streptomyces sp. NPDC014872 TaxID=3364926 RepID=UPI0036F57711
MSDLIITAVYLIMATVFLVIAGWKGLAFLREPSLTLALMTAAFFLGGLVYAMASPAGYRFLGDVFDQPWAATLPIYVGILLCYADTHILTLLWTPATTTPRRRIRQLVAAWTTAYAAAITAMTLTFLHAKLDGPADPLKFNTQQANDPAALAFLAILLTVLSCGTLNTFLRVRRTAPEDPKIAHAMQWFGGSMLVTFGYVICSAPAITAAALGYDQLEGVGVAGAGFGILGCLGTCYGMTGAAVTAWLKERRDIRLLQPLWNLVVRDVDQRFAFSPASAEPPRWVNVRFGLHRRIIEILDGIRELRSWADADVGQAVSGPQNESLAEQDLEAIRTAVILRDAVARYQASRPPKTSAHAMPKPAPTGPAQDLPGAGIEAHDERARLVRVARYLDHPLVAQAVDLAAQRRETGLAAAAPIHGDTPEYR